VLVADDEAVTRDLVRMLLMSAGAEVTEAVDGLEATERAAEWPYDVVVLSLGLGMDGLNSLEVLDRIRAGLGPNDATPLIVYGAGVGPESAGRLVSQGFEAALAKPIQRDHRRHRPSGLWR
jgi:CheY-like chemotaxis protein